MKLRYFTGLTFGCAVVVSGAIGVAIAAEEVPAVLQKAINAPMPSVNFAPAFAASNFVTKIDNPYFPLTSGTTMVYTGIKDAQSMKEDYKVTKDRKMILGVNTMVIYDVTYEAGKMVEETYDWYAQDKEGNVWYFGEQTRALDKGKWTTEGSWQAGVDGAKPGIYMQAHPTIGSTYMQEFYQGCAGDSASVLALDQPVTVPIGSYKNAQLTMEWSTDDPGSIDAKFYVRGIGVVREIAATGATEMSNLTSVKKDSGM